MEQGNEHNEVIPISKVEYLVDLRAWSTITWGNERSMVEALQRYTKFLYARANSAEEPAGVAVLDLDEHQVDEALTGGNLYAITVNGIVHYTVPRFSNNRIIFELYPPRVGIS